MLDDEALFRKGLELLISSPGEIEVVLSCDDGPAFFEQLELLPTLPHIVLLDIRMKPMDGFAVTEKLLELHRDLKIIILSSYYESTFLRHMVELGVSAFLPKNSSQALLQEAIRKVQHAGVFFSEQDHSMMAGLVHEKKNSLHFTPIDHLTERELEVIRHICSEQTNKEISEKLFISKRTVENHRLRIIEKLGAKNTAGLVVCAIMHGIYRPDYEYYFST